MNPVLLVIIAIVGAEVHPVSGPMIPNGTVIIDGEKIRAVGAELLIPEGAHVIDAKGKTVTPGLIDAWTQLGMVEVRNVPDSNDLDIREKARIRASRRVTDAYNPYSAVIPIQRVHGLTTVLSVPSGGLVSGQAAVYDLVPSRPVVRSAAIRVNLGGRRKTSRDQDFAALRELVDDTRAFARNRAAADRNQFRPTSTQRLDLEAMIRAAAGRQPLVIDVDRRIDIERVLTMANKLKLRVILVGAAEGWMVADQIAAAKVPVIVEPWLNIPLDFDRLHARQDAVKLLADAGVDVIISSFSTHNARKLRQWAGNAVRAGLSHDHALRAITVTPAEAFSIPKRGTLASGQMANVVIWSGDPFEFSTQAEQIFIRGESVDMGHRQQALRERYRVLKER